ncbi:MAG: hypothetical protein M1815_004061 [Lichina confinis]|nr:MAG: hypothetical protein M1815_004061 [Lichina confinis]
MSHVACPIQTLDVQQAEPRRNLDPAVTPLAKTAAEWVWNGSANGIGASSPPPRFERDIRLAPTRVESPMRPKRREQQQQQEQQH